MKHFLTLKDYSKDEILEIINLAIIIKKETKEKIFKNYMAKQTLGMIFEKSSTRTRVSFETGIFQLGGIGLFLSSNDIQLGRGEPAKDTARAISSMVDMLMIRNDSQDELEEFAKYSKVPIINGLTNKFHPIQLMADYMTILEYGLANNIQAVYIGDGNNMAHSWLMLAAKLGFNLNIATPKGYEVDPDILKETLKIAKASGAKINVMNDPRIAIQNATVVTTDTWISMGQENEREKRLKDFKGFIVDANLMNLADKKAIFLHCLPAYRNYEVSEEVFEKFSKTIFDEAENRLHAQKGIMVYLNRNRG
ncbi:Ornithine carbamoyltransferase [hydrothermal vent metagenome]|uniref:ornithine carbamoyltransferase n=1 Tax=hydrothermal vent metagenome TaxID=652676 RepID=A0A3B1E945_9ZZZZ